MNGEAGLLDFRNRQLVFHSLQIPHHHFSIVAASVRIDNFHFYMTTDRRKSRALNRRATSDEPLPILERLQRTFQPRRRHLQHVPPVDQSGVGVERRLDCPRSPLTVTHLNFFAVAAVNPYIKHRARPAAADPEIDQVVSDQVKLMLYNGLQTAIHVDSAFLTETKKCGATSPTSHRRSKNHRTSQ